MHPLVPHESYQICEMGKQHLVNRMINQFKCILIKGKRKIKENYKKYIEHYPKEEDNQAKQISEDIVI